MTWSLEGKNKRMHSCSKRVSPAAAAEQAFLEKKMLMKMKADRCEDLNGTCRVRLLLIPFSPFFNLQNVLHYTHTIWKGRESFAFSKGHPTSLSWIYTPAEK